MRKILVLFIMLVGGFQPILSKGAASDFREKSGMNRKNADDEYDRYKKRADEFFDRGDYQNALRQYRNCLEVPTYENDPYAKGRIALAEKLLKLRQEAYQSLNAGKGEAAVGLFEQMVAENPKDSITKVNLTDYWTGEATKSYAHQEYGKAKVQYREALKYATKPALIEMQIQNSEAFIKLKAEQAAESAQPVINKESESKATFDPSKSPTSGGEIRRKSHAGIKIAVAAVGLGAGAYAYTLNKQYQTKLDEVNRIGRVNDPDGDNVILTAGEFDQWQTARQAAADAKRKRAKFVASLGVCGVAAITEVVLLALPGKRKPTGFSAGASTGSVGLAVRYTFK